MTTQTLAALRQLKLGGMANALQSQLEQIGTYEGLAFTERLALLVEQECLRKLINYYSLVHCGDQPATDRSMICQHRRQHPRRRHPGPTDAQRTPASTQGEIHAQDTHPIDGR
jgi:hypothetical protein